MKRRSALSLLAVFLLFSIEPLHASGMRQRNPVAQAPATINNDPYATSVNNEYPMFSKDGRLFLWTRQDIPTPNTQWLWIAFLKNRDYVAATPAGTAMRPLDFGPPQELHIVNHEFCSHKPECKPGNPAGNEIKALMLCEEPDPVQPTVPGTDKLRYRFTLYLAVGPMDDQREMYRAHRIVVVVKESTGQILSVAMSGGFDEAIPYTTRPSGGQANETEPAMTRDGQYLFWASNAWAGGNTMANYIGPVAACTQLMQSPTAYSTLPSNRFAWKDQYTSGFYNYQRTSRTNYHAIVEKASANDTGATALIFEECQGQTDCNRSLLGDRDCECEDQNEWLSTTGFASGGKPTVIANLAGTSNPLNTTNSMGVPVRVTHPAISGPQTSDGRWLLFFMRGKKIWYTMISE